MVEAEDKADLVRNIAQVADLFTAVAHYALVTRWSANMVVRLTEVINRFVFDDRCLIMDKFFFFRWYSVLIFVLMITIARLVISGRIRLLWWLIILIFLIFEGSY